MAVATGDAPQDVDAFRRDLGVSYPVLIDAGGAAQSFEVVSSPTCILVRTDGTIAYRGSHPPERLP